MWQAVYGVLYEAEHRSTFYVPYWKFPPARWLVPRQRKFADDMAVINRTLTDLINQARDTRQVSHATPTFRKRGACYTVYTLASPCQSPVVWRIFLRSATHQNGMPLPFSQQFFSRYARALSPCPRVVC